MLMIESLLRLHGNCRLELLGDSLEENRRFRHDYVGSCVRNFAKEITTFYAQMRYALVWDMIRTIRLGRIGMVLDMLPWWAGVGSSGEHQVLAQDYVIFRVPSIRFVYIRP